MVSAMIDELLYESKNEKVKSENENDFYFYDKIFNLRKQKYMEYLGVEYGYKTRRKNENGRI